MKVLPSLEILKEILIFNLDLEHDTVVVMVQVYTHFLKNNVKN